RLWPGDTFVDFDSSLRVAVGKLREALDDNAEDPRYIETVPKRGYRFLVTEVRRSGPPAPVAESAGESEPLPISLPHVDVTQKPASSVRSNIVVITVIGLIALGLFLWHRHVSG